MAGGTLVVSREVKNHSYFKKRLGVLGFGDVSITASEKDALNSVICEKKPDLLMISARFYQGTTPYHVTELKRNFPNLNIVAVAIGEYPDELAMYFILNGAKSYVTSFDGFDQFYEGLDEVAKGKEYISPGVKERINLRVEYPISAAIITDRQKQIIRLMCNGYRQDEIAENLHISRNTVNVQKTKIYTALNVRNPYELIRNALSLEYVKLNEIFFYPKDFVVNPQPDKKPKKRGRK